MGRRRGEVRQWRPRHHPRHHRGLPRLDVSVRVFGTKGSAVISDDELVYFHRNAGQATELHMPVPAADTNQVAAHGAQFADFVDAIRSDRLVRVGTREARAVLAVVLGISESAASGEPVLTARA